MGKDYVTFSRTKVPETRYLKVLPYSINAARDVLYQESGVSNKYMFDPERSSGPYFKHLGYGLYDLQKLYDIPDSFIEAEKDWFSIKKSNAFIPDKLLSLYKYAKEFDKTADKTDITIYKNKDFCKNEWADSINVWRLGDEDHFKVREYLTSDEDDKTLGRFKTLKDAFIFIADLIKDNQDLFSEFRVVTDEDYFIERFYHSFTPDASNHSDGLDYFYHPYTELRDEEKPVIKAASEELIKEGFFLNVYYFQYVHESILKRYNKPSDVRRSTETERILAKTQKEAEDIFYEKYPHRDGMHSTCSDTYMPLSFQNKADIEDCEREIEIYKERLERLKKETPKDLVRVETGFDG